MNKTKEEILKEVIYEFPQLGIKAGQLYDNTGRHATIDVYGAMDQWADQQSSSLKEENQKLREALEGLCGSMQKLFEAKKLKGSTKAMNNHWNLVSGDLFAARKLVSPQSAKEGGKE